MGNKKQALGRGFTLRVHPEGLTALIPEAVVQTGVGKEWIESVANIAGPRLLREQVVPLVAPCGNAVKPFTQNNGPNSQGD